MRIEDQIRGGVMINDPKTGQIFRGVFIDGNFYLYMYVERTVREPTFEGRLFNDDTLVLMYSNIRNPDTRDIAPSFVRVRG